MIPQNEQQWYDQWQRADELETIFHVFSNMARTETNQKFMTKYERIANSAIIFQKDIVNRFIFFCILVPIVSFS